MNANIRSWDSIEAGVKGLPISVPNDPGNHYVLAAMRLENVNEEFMLLTGQVDNLSSNDDLSVRVYGIPTVALATPGLLTYSLTFTQSTGTAVEIAKSPDNNKVDMSILKPMSYHLSSGLGSKLINSSSELIYESVDWSSTGACCLILVSPLVAAIQEYHITLTWLERS